LAAGISEKIRKTRTKVNEEEVFYKFLRLARQEKNCWITAVPFA
jgi:hypothetical protein